LKKRTGLIIILSIFLSSTGFAGDKSDKPIDIAAIYALSGPAAQDDAYSLVGVRIAVKEVNQKGGVLGRKLNLMVIDNQSSPIGSHLAAEKADKTGVAAIVGAAWSSHSIAVAKVAQERKIPMISSISTNPRVTKIGNYIFRVCFTDDYQGIAMARFARKELNAQTAVTFIDLTSDYSLGLSKIFRENFEKLGGKVLKEIEYKLKQKDYIQQIRQAKNTTADVLFLSGHDESGQIAYQAQEAGITAIILGGDGWSDPSFFSKGGNKLKRGFYSSHWSEFSGSERSRIWAQTYADAAQQSAGAALGYDAVLLLVDAIRRAAAPDREAIREALAHMKSFDGVTGKISFNAYGDPVKSVIIMEIINGKPYYLKTLNP
jgi:branched-chain amino acid transport system substrate-binding protein